MLSMGLLPIIRLKDIERSTYLRVCLQIDDLEVSCSHLCGFKLFKVSSFSFIHSHINYGKINLVSTREKIPRENKHTAVISFYEVEPTYTIVNYRIFTMIPSDPKLRKQLSIS